MGKQNKEYLIAARSGRGKIMIFSANKKSDIDRFTRMARRRVPNATFQRAVQKGNVVRRTK